MFSLFLLFSLFLFILCVAAASATEASKNDIVLVHQIRSYVLDQSRIKDLRTGIEDSDCDGVLDGDINHFLEASLKQGL